MNEFYLHDKIIYNGEIGWIKIFKTLQIICLTL